MHKALGYHSPPLKTVCLFLYWFKKLFMFKYDNIVYLCDNGRGSALNIIREGGPPEKKGRLKLLFEHTCAYARWALMHRFASVCPSVCGLTKIQTRN